MVSMVKACLPSDYYTPRSLARPSDQDMAWNYHKGAPSSVVELSRVKHMMECQP